MAILKTRESCCLLLLCLVFSLGHTSRNGGVKKHASCIHIVSINAPNDDPAQIANNFAFQANDKQASLGRDPGVFQIKHGGFLGIKETVAIESAQKPGYYLRHKNYKFHLQKAKNSSVFARDATFYLLKVQNDPPLYAFELYDHPSWFIMHNSKKHTLMLGHVKGSENEVMDSTFSLKKVHCHQKRGQGRVQKKTVVVGHGALMEDQSDDDPNDMEYNEEYVSKENANTAPAAFQTNTKEDKNDDRITGSQGKLIIKNVVSKSFEKDNQKLVSATKTTAKTESGNVANKEQDIIHEVEQAFSTSNTNKNRESLDMMEKDIERKVNDLASSLYEQRNKKTFSGEDSSSVDVVIQDSDNSSRPEKEAIDQDVIIKVGDPDTKDGSVKSSLTNKPKLFGKERLKTVNPFAFTKNNKIASNIVKGSPKLVNEHYDIIARTSLAIPEGNKEKRQNRLMESKLEAGTGYKHDQILDKQNQDKKRVQPKVQNMKQLFGSMGKSVHISYDGSSLNTVSTAGTRRDSQPANTYLQYNNTKIRKKNATIPLPQHKPQQKLNGTLGTNGRPVVYFSETCQNSLPSVCEVWAQKRYCLTFNELMKRYCRKSCGLCDPIVTTGFSPCDKSCGGGIRLRMIKVNNRQVLQRRACNTHPCPIDGGYTQFSDFSECSATCGKGLRYKHRTCTQPPPQFGGRDCIRLGSPIKTVECHVAKCEVPFTGKKLSKQSHSQKQANDDYEHMPEYQVEKLTNGGYTVHIDTPQKFNGGIFKHINGNLYQYSDSHGKKKMVRLKGKHEKSLHEHHVYHKGKQVGKLKCGGSKFPKYHRREPNYPLTTSILENQKRELGDPYKMYEGGKIMYDKYGIPSGSTDEVVKSAASPYKLILHKNKNHDLVVSEECLESDASVDPDEEEDDFENKSFQKPAQGFYGDNFGDPSHSYGSSSLLAQSTLGNEVRQAMGSIGRAIDYDTNAIATSSLLQKEVPKLSLSEELAAENEEALKERRYEENIAEKSNERFAFP